MEPRNRRPRQDVERGGFPAPSTNDAVTDERPREEGEQDIAGREWYVERGSTDMERVRSDVERGMSEGDLVDETEDRE